VDDLHVSVKAESLWDIDLGPLGTLNITNSFLTMIIVMAFLIIGGAMIARRASVDRPGKAQTGFELIIEFLLNLVESTAGKRVGRQIFPLIGGLFIFIIVANYSGLLPGVGTVGIYHTEEEEATTEEARIASAQQPSDAVVVYAAEEGEGHHEVLYPFLRSPNADLNMTLAMALVTFTVVQIAGVVAHGVVGRIKHMGDPPFMFPIEVISELSRIVSLSFRLFGNIFAGEVLVTVMVTMAAAVMSNTFWIPVFFFGLPTIFLLLEVLFGFIQALVFALLTLIYIALAAAGHHDDHEHEHVLEPAEGHAVGGGKVVPAGAGGD
jgi:F-type H+-transporting ATPase subunit a